MLKSFVNFFTPGKRPREEPATESPTANDSESIYSDIDREYLADIPPNYDSEGEYPGSRYVGPPYPGQADGAGATSSSVDNFYPSRMRLWCCKCNRIASLEETMAVDGDTARVPGGGSAKAEDEEFGYSCAYCKEYLFSKHDYCDQGCALVRIVDVKLPDGTEAVFSAEAWLVAREPVFSRGGVRRHGPLFYVVECCKRKCPGMYRVELTDGELRQDTEEPWADGILMDFTKFFCPDCGKKACKQCMKLVVATQVIVGGVDTEREHEARVAWHRGTNRVLED